MKYVSFLGMICLWVLEDRSEIFFSLSAVAAHWQMQGGKTDQCFFENQCFAKISVVGARHVEKLPDRCFAQSCHNYHCEKRVS